MSKVVVYVLDKIVWILLIAAVTTQALQIAGVVPSPKALGEISYQKDDDYNFQVGVGESDVRGKRQTTQDRSKFIDTLFNIPISALQTINNLVQSARPAFQSLREFAARRFDKSGKSNESQNTPATAKPQRLYPIFIRPKEDST